MVRKSLSLDYDLFDSSEELPAQDAALVEAARQATLDAYAPYSRFYVSAATYVNGKMITATNQENASYPVGICAERTLLGVLATQHQGSSIEVMAIAYQNMNEGSSSDKPISPCGLCRQSLVEFEIRNGGPIRLLLTGMQGEVIQIASAANMLPFSFSPDDLK